MSIEATGQLIGRSAISELPEMEGVASKGSGLGSQFGSVFETLKTLDDIQRTAESEALRVAEGRPGNFHDTALAIKEAELSFQFAMSIRNKLVQAYEELMRTQV